MAVDANDNVFVTDFGGHSVDVFSQLGALRGEFGSNTNDNFELDQPAGIAIDSVGNIYVADTDNSRIKKFTPS